MNGDVVNGAPPAPARTAGSAQPTVRRLIVYTLLFALVVVGAVGLSGLLGRLLGAGTVLAAEDVGGLARSLAFTLIGGPLAAVLWWVVWRRLGESTERSSVAWGLYLAAVYTVSLITFSTALLGLASALIDGAWQGWQSSLSTGLAWAGVWAWHRWMWQHPLRRPVHLASVPTVAGSVFGLVIGVGGAVTALADLVGQAVRTLAASASVGDPWWRFALQALVWAAGGAAIWWWHWIHDGSRRREAGLANVALVVVGILGPVILALGGVGTVLFVLLRLAFDRTDPLGQLLDPLGPAVAAGCIGAVVWVYHRTVAVQRSEATRQSGRLVTAGAALVAAATGIGVVVNSSLGIAATPLAGADTRTLLLGGISSLVVGGPLWWFAWKPGMPPEPTEPGQRGRRVYLIAVFGLSAIVAVITLLVIGYRVFEFLLGDATAGSLVDRIRAPLGLLVATVLAAGYHFAVWRRDRLAASAAAPARPRTVGHVILVTGADPEPLSRLIGEITGAGVSVWRRADGDPSRASAVPGAPGAGELAEQLALALQSVVGDRILVVTGPGSRVEVIPLTAG